MFKTIKINRILLPIKGQYFLFNAGAWPLFLAVPVYAKQLGFSSHVVGIVLTILPIISMIVIPIIGKLADKYKCRKYAFLLLQCSTALAFLALIFLPEVPKESKAYLTVKKSSGSLKICDDNINKNYCSLKNLMEDDKALSCKFTCNLEDEVVSVTYDLKSHYITRKNHCIKIPIDLEKHKFLTKNTLCDVHCNSPVIRNIIQKTSMNGIYFYKYYEFWLFFLIACVIWISYTAATSIADVICLDTLGDHLTKYGEQLVYSSLGIGIFSGLFGFLQDTVSDDDFHKNFTPGFILGAGVILLSVLVSSTIQYKQPEEAPSTLGILNNIAHILKNIPYLVFLIWVIIMGAFLGAIFDYFYWVLEDLALNNCETQHYIKTIEGLATTIEFLLGNSIFFLVSPVIIKKIGYSHAMSTTLLVISIRFGLYYLLTSPWWALPVSILSGPTFGLFYVTMASYSFKLAPPGSEATTQLIVLAAYDGIGESIGAILAGEMLEIFGGSTTFGIFGIAAGVLFLLHVIVQIVIQRRCNHKNCEKTKADSSDKIIS